MPPPSPAEPDARRPRVLIVSAGLLHDGRDPRTIRARRLIEGLGRRGFEIDALSLWLGEGRPPAVPGVRRAHAIEAPIDWDGAAGGSGGSGDAGAANAEGLAEWVERSAAAAAALPEGERPDLVYAIGVPVSALAAGAAVAEACERPLIADLGDPWITPEGDREAAGRRARVLGSAAALLTTTPELAAELEPLLPAGAPVLLAPAGGVLRQRLPREPGRPPLVVHMGAINAGRVDPRPAFEALAALHGAGRIEFRSHSTGWHPGLHELPHPHLPLIPHAEALDLLASASAALVLGNDNRAQLPSKAFEIACTETWALCVGEPGGDPAAELLTGTGHAVAAEANTEPAVRAAAEEILGRESRGERPAPAERYTWARRIEEIAALIERTIGR